MLSQWFAWAYFRIQRKHPIRSKRASYFDNVSWIWFFNQSISRISKTHVLSFWKYMFFGKNKTRKDKHKQSVNYFYKWKSSSLNWRPLLTLRKSVCHSENHKIHREFRHLFKADLARSCTVPVRESPLVLVAFVVGRVILHWAHAHVMCIYGGVGQRIHGKSKSGNYLHLDTVQSLRICQRCPREN